MGHDKGDDDDGGLRSLSASSWINSPVLMAWVAFSVRSGWDE